MKKELKPLIFKKQYFIRLVFIVSLLFIASSYIYYNHSEKETQTDKENDLETIATLKINQIIQWNEERNADIKTTSGDPYFVSSVEKWLINKNNKSISNKIRYKLAILQKEYGYEQIFLTSKTSEILLSAVSDLPSLDNIASSKIIESVNSGVIEKTDLYYCKTHNKIHFDITAPLVNDKKQIVAAILFRVDPSTYLFPLIQTWPNLSKTAESLLIRRERDKVLFLNNLKFQKNVALKLEFPLTRKDIPAVQAVLGYTGIMEGNDYRGVRVLSYISDIPGTNWYLVSKIDYDEIFSEFKFQETILALLFFALILLLISGTFWVYHFQQRNVYRELYNSQEEFKTTLYSITDAVITADKKGRIKNVNSTAEKLTGWSEAEAKGEKLERVFKIINEETRNKAENPLRKALAKGAINEFANHTLLVSKNGLEIPINDSEAPIRDEAGEIVGVVLVFRDQSEERLSNKILNKRLMLYEYSQTHVLNELLSKMLDEVADFTKSPVGFFYFMLPDQDTLHLQAWTAEAEKVFDFVEGKDLHYKVSEAGVWADAVRQRKPLIHNDYSTIINQNEILDHNVLVIRDLVLPVLKNDKIVAVLRLSNKSIDYAEIDVEVTSFLADLFWEIADKKKKENLVIQSENFLKEAQKIAQLGSYVLDIQTGNWTSTKMLDDIFGIEIGYDKSVEGWTKLIHPEWKQPMENYLINEVIRFKKPFNKEYKIVRRSDNTERWIHGIGELVLNKDNQPIKMIGSIRDITESKTAEQKIKNLNRVYSLLSNTNEAIVRIKDRQKLFDKICKISVNEGQFIMAWIGIVNNDTNKVEVAAAEGLIEDYLEHINVDLSDEIRREHPTGKAILFGNQFTTNDIENDRSMLPWKENALKLGYKSSASFPLKVFGKTVGAFSIYSDQKNFFLNNEIRLLDEMATDISFALEIEQSEITRRMMEDKLQESEERFRSLYENSTIGLYRTTPEGKILLANPTLVSMLGYSSFEELVTKDLEKDNSNSLFNRRQFIQEIELKGEVKGFEAEWRRKDGTVINIKEGARAICDSKGETLYYDGIVEDITARKRSEEALKESQQFIKGIINAIPVRVFWKDKNLVYIGCNSIFANDAGFTNPEEIIGKDDYQMVWKNEAELYRADDNKVIESGESKILFEESQTTPDGNLITLLTSKIPLRNLKGECIGLLGTYIDITEREKTQIALLEREERYRSVTETANDAIITTDAEGIIISWNNGAEKIFGYKEEEVLGETLNIIIPPGYFENQYNDIEPIEQEDEDPNLRKTVELEATHKSGKKLPVELSLSKWETDTRKFYTGIIRDITERRQAESELKKLSRAVEQSPASVIITNKDGDIDYVNEKFCDTTGYSKDEVIGKNPRFLNSGYHDKNFYADLWDTILDGENWDGEMQNKKKNGELFWESALISPLFDNEGNTINYIAVKEDITEKKKITDELIAAKEKAEELSRLKSNFLANMSHELRTPLVGILGFADIIRQDEKSPELKKMAEIIYKSGNRLSETLNLILDISNFESEKRTIRYSKIDLVSKGIEVIELFKEEANKKGLDLVSSFSHDVIRIYFDERALFSILNNLINNAIKFTNEGTVTLQISLKDSCVEIKVIDTGIGISEADQEYVFEEFRQVSEGFSRNFEGSGLGLSITKKIIDKFGGTINITSEVQKGSTFTVILPNLDAVNKNSDREPKVNQIPKIIDKEVINKSLALLVDDDPSVFLVMNRYANEFINLETTTDPEFAIKMLKKKKFDLIFMDINLKCRIDGKEATKKIRALNGYETIPIIAITAYAMVGDKEEFLAAGCSHYLSKPFNQVEITGLLQKIL